MKFSIRGLFAFEFSLAIPHFWQREPTGTAADYELERFFIAGFQYHNGPELVEELEAGTELVLIHEKDNPHDPWAVAFHIGNSHPGYIPRQRNRTIAALLDQGRSASRPDYPARFRRRPLARCRGGRLHDRRPRPPRAWQE
jgi:HIRAN domain-containing protein